MEGGTQAQRQILLEIKDLGFMIVDLGLDEIQAQPDDE